MTENNAAQPGLEDLDPVLAAKMGMLRQRIPATDKVAREFFDATYDHMLSKLRAEGVQAGAPMLPSDALDALRDFKLTVIQDGFHKIGKPMIQQLAQAGALESLGFGKHRVTEYGEWLLSSSGAALASAPVAGEAQPVCWIERAQLESVRDEGNDAWVYWRETGHAAEPDEVPLYAAPQASEAVPAVGIAREHELREIMAALILEYEDEGITAQTLKTARDAIYRPYQNAALSMQTQESRVGTNSGHGHVWDRPDGFRARCGGPGICFMCSADHARANTKQADKDGGDCAKGAGDVHFIAGTIVTHLNGPLDPAGVMAAARAITAWAHRQPPRTDGGGRE